MPKEHNLYNQEHSFLYASFLRSTHIPSTNTIKQTSSGYRTRLSLTKVTRTPTPPPPPFRRCLLCIRNTALHLPFKTTQGRRSGHVRYRDFVKAMGDSSSPRGPGLGSGSSSRVGGGKRKGHRRRSSLDDIERLVDRLKEVGKSQLHAPVVSEYIQNEKTVEWISQHS